MIRVTRIDGSALVVNVDLVKWVERTPDTVLSMVSGERLLVRESPEQVVESVIAFKRAVRGGARRRPRPVPDTSGGDRW